MPEKMTWEEDPKRQEGLKKLEQIGKFNKIMKENTRLTPDESVEDVERFNKAAETEGLPSMNEYSSLGDVDAAKELLQEAGDYAPVQHVETRGGNQIYYENFVERNWDHYENMGAAPRWEEAEKVNDQGFMKTVTKKRWLIIDRNIGRIFKEGTPVKHESVLAQETHEETTGDSGKVISARHRWEVFEEKENPNIDAIWQQERTESKKESEHS